MDWSLHYFDLKHAVDAHDSIIDKSGGLDGYREIGLLESVLAHIQDDRYYPEFEDKLAHLIFSVNKLHAFNDGNKRASLILGAYFMELNGYDYCVERFWFEFENYAVSLAEGRLSKDVLQQMLRAYIYDEEYSETLKLTLMDALGGLE
ncbi:type II toxin-antitoxin system death-on-curing family toxin [Leucothrix pacifica]|uniref:Type II toxin-antitoxin system death-on-curing family toxin n=1 Tax=Leucothrix pacifica TaxID=1247513 RepID=A0A317C1R0_9GAMM|nr:type II toxin-antitoxin system death-on-curing family toxin [Leucothrix pacifica]PWQ92488.1 type II toxin-antitoxin system death-on-curing family toxin [Leucothrix pacifica]